MIVDREETTLWELLTLLWARKVTVFSVTGLVTLLGTCYGFLIQPIYRSEAVIAPKETQAAGGASALLAQIGGVGGLVASHLGFGNADLNRLEVIFQSREVSEAVIRDNSLLSKLFPKKWDERESKWKPDKGPEPSIRDGVEFLKKNALEIESNSKKNILLISVSLPDSILAAQVAGYFLEAVNKKIKEDAKQDAEMNRKYLMDQLAEVSDPLLREKIQQLMANEIERTMLVSTSSFDLLERPAVPIERERPNRKLIFVFSLLLGFGFSVVWIVGSGVFLRKKPPG